MIHDATETSLYRQAFNPLRGLTVQRVVALLENSMQGYYADLTWLYSFIERRDDVVFALTERRLGALRACNWLIELNPEANESPEMLRIAEEQRDALKKHYGKIVNLREAWTWLGTATFRQFAHLEKHWENRGGELIVRRLEPVEQWFFCRNIPSLEWLYNANAMQTNRGDPIAPENWIVRERNGSIGELAATRFVMKSMAGKDWGAYTATFGIPNVGIEVGPEAAPSQAEYERLRTTVLNNFVSNGRYIMPPHCKLVTGPEAPSADHVPFDKFIAWIDTALVLAGTGGKLTMLTDSTGIGQGATGAHQDAFDEIADAEGMEIAEVIDRQHGHQVLERLFPGQPILAHLAIRRNRPVSKKEGAEVLTNLRKAGWEPDEVEAEKLVDMPLTRVQPVDDGEEKRALNRDYERHPAGDEHGGEFAPKGGGTTTQGMSDVKRDAKEKAWKMSDGKDVPEHVKNLGIPPAWTDVRVSTDPNADLLAIGRDSKGRVQRIYSDSFEARSAAAKFARNKELIEKEGEIVRQNRKNWTADDVKTRDNAHALSLVHHTGIRPGSDAETGAAVKAYGATTLEGRHVHVAGDDVRLKFTGKKGVALDIPVHDPEIKSMLKARKASAGDAGRLFDISDSDLRDYTHTMDGGGFKTKDFRTLRGTNEAYKHVQGLPRAANQKEYEKTVKGIAKKVSEVLGNTPTIALKSYINPHVWESIKPL